MCFENVTTSHDSLLDVGCGFGEQCWVWARLYSQLSIHGVCVCVCVCVIYGVDLHKHTKT